MGKSGMNEMEEDTTRGDETEAMKVQEHGENNKRKTVEDKGRKTSNMGLLNSTLKSENRNFSIKKYGYSKFSNFLRSFGCFKIDGDKVSLQ